MCGITGIIAPPGVNIPLEVLQRMTDAIAHRGPDGEGFLVSGRFVHKTVEAPGAPGRIGLGHRRLAILDLTDRGLQPLTVDGGKTWIVFNGEIYNHRELRTELEARGCRFETRTDTEVLLQGYLAWGEDVVSRCQGMFAFAIWDGPKNRLFCARDRLGIKPFYYTS